MQNGSLSYHKALDICHNQYWYVEVSHAGYSSHAIKSLVPYYICWPSRLHCGHRQL